MFQHLGFTDVCRQNAKTTLGGNGRRSDAKIEIDDEYVRTATDEVPTMWYLYSMRRY